jgi:PKD repeat protein
VLITTIVPALSQKWLLPAVVLLASACSKDDDAPGGPAAGEPTVAFGYSVNGYVAPTQVTFANQSKNATSYLWDFGDGTTSTAASPVHVYTAAGQYAIKLTAYNDQASKTAGITIGV